MVLLQATCEECREITRKFEDHCLNDMFGPARARLQMSRKDRAKPTRLAHVIYRDGREEDREVDVEQIPAAMVIPSFPTAAIFQGLAWTPQHMKMHQIVFSEALRKQTDDVISMRLTLPCDPKTFARMLCKIGLGAAHYTFGPDAYVPIAREFIRTGEGGANDFVGGFANLSGAPELPTTFHHLDLRHYNEYLVAVIQLFGEALGPINYAVVGTLRRMPPGLPPLHLGAPLPRQNRIPDPPASGDPTTLIRWDQTPR